eukprot:4157546-Prymnesium_polylepis.1
MVGRLSLLLTFDCFACGLREPRAGRVAWCRQRLGKSGAADDRCLGAAPTRGKRLKVQRGVVLSFVHLHPVISKAVKAKAVSAITLGAHASAPLL